jgi:hypothetical protein
VPRATLDGTLIVRVVLVVAGFGVKLLVAPDGTPLTAKLTGELNPLLGVIVTL